MTVEKSDGWLIRINEISETAFDSDAALALAQEIKDSADSRQVSYRASQTLFILERLRSGGRGLSKGKAAFAPVEKALRRCG